MRKIKVRNWSRWQTYRSDRGMPPWIKLHRCLLRNIDWITLTDEQRGQLVSIWILAADDDGRVPADAEALKSICRMTNTPDLNLLRDKGFLDFDASVTPTRRQDDANVTPPCQPLGANVTPHIMSEEGHIIEDVCPVTPERVPAPASFIDMPVKEGVEPITEQDVAGWEKLYGRIDVRQALRNMVGYWSALPANQRKTRRGIRKSIVTWLANDDGRAPVVRPAVAAKPKPKIQEPEDHPLTAAERAAAAEVLSSLKESGRLPYSARAGG